MEKYMNDLIIIGGGAAGLAAAVAAKRSAPSLQVTVLEKKINQARSSEQQETAVVISPIPRLRQRRPPLLFLSHWESLRGRTAKEESTPFQKARRVWQRFSQTS